MLNAFVYIIESPSDADLLDGRSEGRSLCEALRIADIPHWYSLATTRKAFQSSLRERLVAALSHFNVQPGGSVPSRLPILHLSMHGNNAGISLTCGEFIAWEDLRQELSTLTNSMQGGLLICMSSCFGSSGCRMAMHERPDHPFWALVGNKDSVPWADAVVGYIVFYHSFFKNVLIGECVDRMKLASGDANFCWHHGPSVKNDWVLFTQLSKSQEILAGLQAVTPNDATSDSSGTTTV